MDVGKRDETFHKTTYFAGWYVKSANIIYILNVAFLYILNSIGRAYHKYTCNTNIYIYMYIYLMFVN